MPVDEVCCGRKPLVRIAFAGAQDTGKTTVAKEMSSRFKARNFITDYVDEAVRYYIGKWKQPMMSLADQLFMLDKQIEREQAIAPMCQLAFFDSPLFLGYAYTLLNWPEVKTSKDIDILMHIYEKILINGHYDVIFYLKPFRVPVEDGIRTKTLIDQNSKIDLMIKSFLDLHNMPYMTVEVSPLSKRMEDVDVRLKEFLEIKNG